MAIKDCTKDQI